jgi:hypothetical protein
VDANGTAVAIADCDIIDVTVVLKLPFIVLLLPNAVNDKRG